MSDLQLPDISPETEIRQREDKEWVFYGEEPIVELGRKKALADYWCHPEPGYEVGRCRMIKRDGQRCRNACRRGWNVCHYHGAGRPGKPGGLTNTSAAALLTTGRHAKHLPHRLIERYEEYISDPDTLSMASELSLLDTRMAEMLERLEKADVDSAWAMVKRATLLIEKYEDGEHNEEACQLLSDALKMKADDITVWKEVRDIIEARRRVAETERRRIMDAQQVMTYQEANALMAFLMSSVMEHVTDPRIRRAIADDLKRVTM